MCSSDLMRESLVKEARQYVSTQEKYLPENLDEALFVNGTRVRHEILGEGTVLEMDPDRLTYTVQFDSVSTPRVLSVRAKLTKI